MNHSPAFQLTRRSPYLYLSLGLSLGLLASPLPPALAAPIDIGLPSSGSLTDAAKQVVIDAAKKKAEEKANEALDRVLGTPTPSPVPEPTVAPAPVYVEPGNASAAPANAGTAPPRTESFVKVGANSLHLVTMGNGPYTVVFETGLTGHVGTWDKVAPAIAKSAKVVLYSRAGNGKSNARPEPLSLNQSTDEFTQMLEAAKLPPPYILVGHSYGAFLIRNYAMQHQDHVLGMVFIDPSDEKQWIELKKVDAAKVSQDEALLRANIPAQFQGELKTALQVLNSGSLPQATPLPDVPTVLLTSTKRYDHPDMFMLTNRAQEIWRELHSQFFRQFSNGAHILTSTSGHHIQQDQPNLVIGGIEQVMASATERAKQQGQQQIKGNLVTACEKAGQLLAARRNRDAEKLVAEAIKSSRLNEAEVNKVGFEFLDQRSQPQVAELVMMLNANNYPNSDKARDNYGVVLLESYKAGDAISQFKKAISMAQANGKPASVIEGYQRHLEKAEQAKKR